MTFPLKEFSIEIFLLLLFPPRLQDQKNAYRNLKL